MNMPKIAIVIGALLSIVGLAGFGHGLSEGKHAYTALIPFFVGTVFELLGVLSLAMPNMRKHFMHALAALALLGTLAALGRLVPGLIRGGANPVAVASLAAMAVLCAAALAFCIKSFRDARKARALEAA
ncbi:MAG: hypothetical protein QM754_13770 [Tepidisphaeraceae bacterium]